MLFNYYILIIVFFISIFIILLLLDVKLKIVIIRRGENDNVNLHFSILNNLLKYQISLPFVDIFDSYHNIIKAQVYDKTELGTNTTITDNQSEEIFNIEEINIFIKKTKYIYKKYEDIFKYITKKLVINNIQWYTQIGLEEAAYTAVFTGILWSLKSTIVLLLKKKFRVNNIYLNVTPYYLSKKLDTTFSCIVTLKIGYIIYAGIKIILTIIRDGDKYERASN